MVDVVLLRLRVRPGAPRLFAELFAGLLRLEQRAMAGTGRFGRALRRALNRSLEPILREEGMYTETVFLARDDGELHLLWYMEAEDVAGVYEAFAASDSELTTVADRVGRWLFEEPEKVLSTDVESDYPLVTHAWNPDRP